MSKVKNYYWDQAEKAVDKILIELKNNAITKEAAKAKIMAVEAVKLLLMTMLMNTWNWRCLNIDRNYTFTKLPVKKSLNLCVMTCRMRMKHNKKMCLRRTI
jgi:hypothetical protein